MTDRSEPQAEREPLGITVLDEPATPDACMRDYQTAQARQNEGAQR